MGERHVGRRLWRRRKRRATGEAVAGDQPTGDERNLTGDVLANDGPDDPRDGASFFHDDDDDDDLSIGGFGAARGTAMTPPPAKPGFFARLFGKKPPPPPDHFVVDPVRDILALPRGAARLDAFEQKLKVLDPKGPDHKKVALGFHRELVALATEAGLDLTLFENRVTACARALIAAGEDERAGTLFAKIGRRHQAAELFVKAGAIDALEEAHAELSFAEGGSKLDARLSFERFEALFLVGLRDEALLALQRAVKLWDNHVYVEVLQGFVARLPPPRRLDLQSGDDVVRIFGRFPLILGRGEESAVRIDSPLVSRGHVQIDWQLDDGRSDLVVKDLVSSGGTRVDGVVIHGPARLPIVGTIDLAGVVVDVERNPQRLMLRPRLRPRQLTLAAFDPVLDDAAVGFRLTLKDDHIRIDADLRAKLNGESLRHETLLLAGDRVVVAGRTWSVA